MWSHSSVFGVNEFERSDVVFCSLEQWLREYAIFQKIIVLNFFSRHAF